MEQDFTSQPWQYSGTLPVPHQGYVPSRNQLSSSPGLYQCPLLECHLPRDECLHPGHASRLLRISNQVPGQNGIQAHQEGLYHDQSNSALMDQRAMMTSTVPRPLNGFPGYLNAPVDSDGSESNFSALPDDTPIGTSSGIHGLGYSFMPVVQTFSPAQDMQTHRDVLQDCQFDPSMLEPNDIAMFGLPHTAGDLRHPSLPLSMVPENGYSPGLRLPSQVARQNLSLPSDCITQESMPRNPPISAITEDFYHQDNAANPFSHVAHPPGASMFPLTPGLNGPARSVQLHSQNKLYNEDDFPRPIPQMPSVSRSGQITETSAMKHGPQKRARLSRQSVVSSEDTDNTPPAAQAVSSDSDASRELVSTNGSVMLPSAIFSAGQDGPQSGNETHLQVPRIRQGNPGSRAPARRVVGRPRCKQRYTPEKRKDVARKRGKVDADCRRKKVRCQHVLEDSHSGHTPPHAESNGHQESMVDSTGALSISAASSVAPWTVQASTSSDAGTPESADPHIITPSNPQTLAPTGLHTPASTGRMTQTFQMARSSSSPYRNEVVLLPASNISDPQLGSQFDAAAVTDVSSAWSYPDEEDGQ